MGLCHVCNLAVKLPRFQNKNYFKTYINTCIAVCMNLFVICLSTSISNAQSINNAPPQTQSIVSALEYVDWKDIEKGLETLSVSTPLGIRLHAFRISPEHFVFSIAQQAKINGEYVEEYATRLDAVIAVNGGFFTKHGDGSLSPVGLLIDDGVQYTRAWAKKGGFLIAGVDGIDILPSQEPLFGELKEVLQSRPVILEKGSKWALNRNLRMIKNRTLVCVLKDKKVVLLTFSGLGLSLFEAGWVLRSQEWGGWFNCDSAIALDGGGSTQLFVKGHPEFNVYGDTAVQNAFVIKRRK